MISVSIDKTKSLITGDELRAASVSGLKAGVRQAEEDFRAEAGPISHKLVAGVSSLLDLVTTPLEGSIVVSAIRPEQPSRTATVHSPGGKTRETRLRPQHAFDFAEIIARGRPAVRPEKAKALLIPANDIGLRPSESYTRAGAETFVVRLSAKAVDANPYDERAIRRTEGVVENVVGEAVESALSRSPESTR
jgi:hypothetical protein